MNSLYNAPPEKYYEACITYHFIQYYRTRYDKAVYPFSISQVQENRLGFDFGYNLPDAYTFLAQYKRPCMQKQGMYAWRIERKQLETLAACPLHSFYVLPAFSEAVQWYEALDKTYFLPVPLLLGWMRQSGTAASALLSEADHIVKTASKRAFDPFGKALHSALQARVPVFPAALTAYFEKLPQDVLNCICGYRIGE